MLLPDHTDREGNWIVTATLPSRRVRTVSGRKWEGMNARCTPGSQSQAENPSYIGCTVGFSDFNEFCEWHQRQVGYGEFEVDKDLMVQGNKIYSAATCILLPRIINMALIGKHKDRGMPIGVHLYRDGVRYRADCYSPDRQGYLGLFETPEEAHQAYLIAKRERLRALADEYKDRLDPRAYQALYAR